jgi:hypothetical protein
MPNPLFKPPRHLVKEWPEVFEDLYMNTLPIAYLETVHLEFANGRVWQVDIKDQLKELTVSDVATRLLDTLQEYKDEITKLDFKVDVVRLKKDISNSTKDIF